ncbi:MAG: alanine dehydrogenase [Bacteroidia bacterium]
MQISKELLSNLAKSSGLLPQEEMLEVARKRGALFIGIPKETSYQENRVALVPEAVLVLVSNGHRVLVETGAGLNSSFQDKDYSEAGAEIAYSAEAVFKADLILKVAPVNEDEIILLQRKQTIISALNQSVQNTAYFRALLDKKINAIAYENIMDDEGSFPVIRAIGEIAGYTAIHIAAEQMSTGNGGVGAMFGGISGVAPTQVVIIGAGTVGENAARAALGLGASIKVFDNSISRLRRLQSNLGQKIYTSVLNPTELANALSTADVAIGALRNRVGRAPCVVTEGMVENMKNGSVIIDVAIDQGGCFETSQVTNHQKPTFRKYGVIHYCVPNIASRVPKTASHALSNVFMPILNYIGEESGLENMLRVDAGVRNGLYTYNGVLTNKYIGQMFGLPYTEIDLLMAAF